MEPLCPKVPAAAEPKADFSPLPISRATDAELKKELQATSQSEIVRGLLEAVHGLMAVLNEKRQILALNDSMLQSLGVDNMDKMLGLRLGEAFHCIHAERAPSGCGSSEYCPSCGAAIAQVIALAFSRPAEQLCALEVPGADSNHNLFFRVRAAPLSLAGHRFVLLFLQDVSQEQRAAALERTFLYDLRNTTTGLTLGTGLLEQCAPDEAKEIVRDIMHVATRLSREIELQRCLADSSTKTFQQNQSKFSLAHFFAELQRTCHHHPALQDKRLEITPPQPDRTLHADTTILHQIVYNMILNALEATEAGGIVKLTAHRDGAQETFEVKNIGYIQPEIARRIFQKNFSTKGVLGHGLGTYSMKLLGEKLLGGRVSFTSSRTEGTCFKFELLA